MKNVRHLSRRNFLATSALGAAALALPKPSPALGIAMDDIPRGERPGPRPEGLEFLNPRGRVPLSFIIDDSTCLVNMGHYCMPQFAEAWPDRDSYKKPWKTWPREIPDDFVRKFGEWCRGHGVKGKYSIVPYPACVGWLDRTLPGWGKRDLTNSIKLVRDFMMPDWDIHSEMITHTRVIDIKTGRPFEEVSSHTMENSHPRKPISVDELASYIAYSLQILKNIDLPCEGFTTPGGFGNLVKSELSMGGAQAVQSVFPEVDIPHYFKYLETGKDSTTVPRIEHASDLKTDNPKVMVNVIGGTGDWFGGWDGVSYGDVEESANRFITADGKGGRMPEMIAKDEPAIMLCHWPGIWCNGEEVGFNIFKRSVERLTEHHKDTTLWMKNSEIARYWAAKELTDAGKGKDGAYTLQAPFNGTDFTVRYRIKPGQSPVVAGGRASEEIALEEVKTKKDLKSGTWWREADDTAVVCFELRKGDWTLSSRS